jgi:hypothetical protein
MPTPTPACDPSAAGAVCGPETTGVPGKPTGGNYNGTATTSWNPPSSAYGTGIMTPTPSGPLLTNGADKLGGGLGLAFVGGIVGLLFLI